MLTVKIDPKLRAQVKALASDLGVSTSELVREALKQRLAQSKRPRSRSVYAATRDLCGVAETTDPGLSARRMSELVRARHARARAR
ncbi:MAG: CopG family transcriptional regulator [Betaproteobacteria bacterium]|nr:CopG family transcriptional regulator [Betaproteobacteria bacterium]